MDKAIAILCGGGPAPGINTVISSVSKAFLKKGYRVIGIHEGFKGLLNKNRKTIDISYELADYLFDRGGSYLKMSRFKPKDSEFSDQFFKQNNIKLLLSIGGDDTASTANRLSQWLQNQGIEIQNIHVPKTIDNDLPLPLGVPTFGFRSAAEEGTRIAKTYFEDARTSQNWFIVTAMGREAGHLALEIGTASASSMIIVPEMFQKNKITAQKIARLAISSMLKRQLMDLPYGMLMISEGIFHFMENKELEAAGVQFTTDSHGHPELHSISKSHVFNAIIRKELKKTKLDIRTRPVEIGFELRTVAPNAFDLKYCSHLGYGVYELFKQKHTGCLVCQMPDKSIKPLFLKDLTDENNKISPRLLDTSSEDFKAIYANMLDYISDDDEKAALAYTSKPEYFNFKKIMG